MLDQFSKLVPKSLMPLRGAVFYSGRNAFQGERDLYVLGLNPGGTDNTISSTVQTVTKIMNPNWSSYQDEIWKGDQPGNYGLQPRIRHMLRVLNLSPYEVPASNVCFVGSSNERKISDKFLDYAECCWPFHQAVIESLKIKLILCFGKSAGSFVRSKINANKKIDEFIENNKRKWKTRVYENDQGLIVIGAAHPSRADWTNPNTDPTPLVKMYLKLVQGDKPDNS